MNGLLAVLLFTILVALILCAVKDSSVTGTYKAFGVYGRILAYLFVDGVTVACAGLFGLLGIFGGHRADIGTSLLLALLGVAMAIVIYWFVLQRCPDMLKDRLLISLLISGFGVVTKISCFFIGAVWVLVSPREMVDEDGHAVYVINNDVYDVGGRKVGEVDPHDSSRYLRTV